MRKSLQFEGESRSRLKFFLLIALASVASVAILAGCSNDDDSGSDSNATNTTGGDAIVTGSAKCDQTSMQEAMETWAKGNGGGKATLPESPVSYRCADGWAVAFPNVGTGEAEVTVTAVFEAEGQFWIPKDRTQVCGKNKAQSDVPASLYKEACQTN